MEINKRLDTIEMTEIDELHRKDKKKTTFELFGSLLSFIICCLLIIPILKNTFLLILFGILSLIGAVWYYKSGFLLAQLKGYSGWIGFLLCGLMPLGLVVLFLLPDKLDF